MKVFIYTIIVVFAALVSWIHGYQVGRYDQSHKKEEDKES